jgi:hypothetical protein
MDQYLLEESYFIDGNFSFHHTTSSSKKRMLECYLARFDCSFNEVEGIHHCDTPIPVRNLKKLFSRLARFSIFLGN